MRQADAGKSGFDREMTHAARKVEPPHGRGFTVRAIRCF